MVVEVYNKTKADRYAATSGNGLAGLLVVAAINELSDETKHEFAYPSPRVIMTPRQTAAVGRRRRKSRADRSDSDGSPFGRQGRFVRPLASAAAAWQPVHTQVTERSRA